MFLNRFRSKIVETNLTYRYSCLGILHGYINLSLLPASQKPSKQRSACICSLWSRVLVCGYMYSNGRRCVCRQKACTRFLYPRIESKRKAVTSCSAYRSRLPDLQKDYCETLKTVGNVSDTIYYTSSCLKRSPAYKPLFCMFIQPYVWLTYISAKIYAYLVCIFLVASTL